MTKIALVSCRSSWQLFVHSILQATIVLFVSVDVEILSAISLKKDCFIMKKEEEKKEISEQYVEAVSFNRQVIKCMPV